MIVLGLDLGTSTGWALLDARGGRIGSGVWNLSGSRHDGPGMRPLRLLRLLTEVLSGYAAEELVVGYENVERHLGTSAAHVYGELRGVVRMTLEERGVPYVAVPVASAKRSATGRGNASKEMMVRAAEERWGAGGTLVSVSEDEADALWIAEAARAELPARIPGAGGETCPPTERTGRDGRTPRSARRSVPPPPRRRGGGSGT